MPELPEVEVTRRQLAPHLCGRSIARVYTSPPSAFFLTSPAALRRRLPGRRIERLDRLGKYLLASLDDGARLLLHLGMTGQLFSEAARNPRLGARGRSDGDSTRPSPLGDTHTHLRLCFAEPGRDVLFRDVRKFGKVKLLEPGRSDPRLDRLGADALDVTAAVLWAASRGRRVAVKTWLLDQSVVAGVGNIYADEALFWAGLRPTRPAHSLTRAETTRLTAAIRGVLARSIERGGSSISDFVSPEGHDGSYQHERRVYSRTGEPCPTCATPIVRCVLGQRSTHYCRGCQR